ncbi:MAG: hypothetical protein AAF708_06990 [Deinococcota bacterium]
MFLALLINSILGIFYTFGSLDTHWELREWLASFSGNAVQRTDNWEIRTRFLGVLFIGISGAILFNFLFGILPLMIPCRHVEHPCISYGMYEITLAKMDFDTASVNFTKDPNYKFADSWQLYLHNSDLLYREVFLNFLAKNDIARDFFSSDSQGYNSRLNSRYIEHFGVPNSALRCFAVINDNVKTYAVKLCQSHNILDWVN